MSEYFVYSKWPPLHIIFTHSGGSQRTGNAMPSRMIILYGSYGERFLDSPKSEILTVNGGRCAKTFMITNKYLLKEELTLVLLKINLH